MSEIRLILSFSVSGRDRLMMVLCIYIRAIKRSSINCRAQNVLLTCTFPARKRCKNTFRSVTCVGGDGWARGGSPGAGAASRGGTISRQVTALGFGWPSLVMPQHTRGFGLCPNFPRIHWSFGREAGSRVPVGPWGAADPGTGHPQPAPGVPTLCPSAGTGCCGRWRPCLVCKACVLKLIKY